VDFKGRLRVAGAGGAGIAADLRLDDIYLELWSEGEELGVWRLDVVEVTRNSGNRFALDLDGESMEFEAADPLGFAYDGLAFINEVSGKLRKKRRTLRKGEDSKPLRGARVAGIEQPASSAKPGKPVLDPAPRPIGARLDQARAGGTYQPLPPASPAESQPAAASAPVENVAAQPVEPAKSGIGAFLSPVAETPAEPFLPAPSPAAEPPVRPEMPVDRLPIPEPLPPPPPMAPPMVIIEEVAAFSWAADVVVEPLPPAPEPVREPEPVAALPEPVREPEPEVVRPALGVVREPEPVAALPEPVREPEPVAALPEPVREPEPVAILPESELVMPEPEPVLEPEPVAILPESELVMPEPEPVLEPEPVAILPEPEPVVPEHTWEPEPVAILPEPELVVPEPVLEPEPVAILPESELVVPELVLEPEPVAILPQPVLEPEPELVVLEPVREPEPVAILPEPVLEPEPVAILPEPVLEPEPVAMLPEPELVLPEPTWEPEAEFEAGGDEVGPAVEHGSIQKGRLRRGSRAVKKASANGSAHPPEAITPVVADSPTELDLTPVLESGPNPQIAAEFRERGRHASSAKGRSNRRRKPDDHNHEYDIARTVGGLTRRVCVHCGHVSFDSEDVYQGWG
jgi:hypothetical protein